MIRPTYVNEMKSVITRITWLTHHMSHPRGRWEHKCGLLWLHDLDIVLPVPQTELVAVNLSADSDHVHTVRIEYKSSSVAIAICAFETWRHIIILLAGVMDARVHLLQRYSREHRPLDVYSAFKVS
jgi:hypothetical protein